MSLDHRPSWCPSLQGCGSYSALLEVLPFASFQGTIIDSFFSIFFLIRGERPDTIRSIVANLVGDDDSGDSLVDENEPIQPLQQPNL